MNIKKAVIPVAGKGTRFLPATKEIPKEMIPLVDRPMIHYAVEEAVLSGIEQIIFITSTGKQSLENYFDRNLELEHFLEQSGKSNEAREIKKLGEMVDVVTVRQKEQLGLGHAILCAKHLIGDEPFAVILADDLVVNDVPVTKQLIDISNANNGSSVIGVMKIPKEETFRYGIVDGDYLKNDSKTLTMRKMVEKPKPDIAPTDLATPGRYILTPAIFTMLEKIEKGVGGEYQLTDAINMLCQKENVFAHIFQGERYDTGKVEGYLEATIEFALNNPKYKNEMQNILKSLWRKYEGKF